MSRARRHIVATDDVVDDVTSRARRGRVERVISEVRASRERWRRDGRRRETTMKDDFDGFRDVRA